MDNLKNIFEQNGFISITGEWETTNLNSLEENLLKSSASVYQQAMKDRINLNFIEVFENQLFQINAYPKADGGMAVFYRDITTEKKKESDLTEALSLRNELLSIASHELKNPITGLKLQAEMAKRSIETQGPDALSPIKVKKIIDNFHTDIVRLKRLVDDMMDVSRLDAGKLSMKYEYFNLDEFMSDVLERLSSTFPSYKDLVKVTINTPVLVKWDRVRMEQVISNLFCNAFKYGNDSQIKLSTSFDDQHILISVSDQGPGIAEIDQATIFDRFKIASDKKDCCGLGLGLYLCHEIVKAHRGTIKLKSSLGKGSTFTVVIPFNELNNPIKA